MLDTMDKTASEFDEPLRGPVADLLREPNPWSDWMADWKVERLSWMRLAAMLLRAVPIAMVANRLATGLAARQAFDAEVLLEMFEDDEDCVGREVDWAFWLERWSQDNHNPHDEVVVELDRELFASFGAELGVGRARQEDGTVTPRALLWFLLSAIRGWAERAGDVSDVKPAARWILQLHEGDRADADPVAALLAHFYDRFKAGGYAPTRPLPDTLAIDTSPMVRGVKRRRPGWRH